MTPQEQQMIDGLISRIRTTQVQGKDAQAEQHIQAGLSGSPDALYVLVQTVLVQQYGLDQAQSQINELKQQVQVIQNQAQQPQDGKSSSGSFLSHIFGGGNSQTQQPPQQTPYQPVNNPGYEQGSYPGGGYPPPPQAYPPQNYPPQNYPPQGGGMFGGSGGGLFGSGGGGGGFLRGAMQAAAGVAAGEIAFRGMEDLFHGFSGQERGFSGAGGGETVVNNYYDDDRGDARRDRDAGDRDGGDRDDKSFYNASDDASRSDRNDRDDGGKDGQNDFSSDSNDFADTGSDDLTAEDNSSDLGGFDDSSNDYSDNS